MTLQGYLFPEHKDWNNARILRKKEPKEGSIPPCHSFLCCLLSFDFFRYSVCMNPQANYSLCLVLPSSVSNPVPCAEKGRRSHLCGSDGTTLSIEGSDGRSSRKGLPSGDRGGGAGVPVLPWPVFAGGRGADLQRGAGGGACRHGRRYGRREGVRVGRRGPRRGGGGNGGRGGASARRAGGRGAAPAQRRLRPWPVGDERTDETQTLSCYRCGL